MLTIDQELEITLNEFLCECEEEIWIPTSRRGEWELKRTIYHRVQLLWSESHHQEYVLDNSKIVGIYPQGDGEAEMRRYIDGLEGSNEWSLEAWEDWGADY